MELHINGRPAKRLSGWNAERRRGGGVRGACGDVREMREAGGGRARAGDADAEAGAAGGTADAGDEDRQRDHWAAETVGGMEECAGLASGGMAAAIRAGTGDGGGDDFDFDVHGGIYADALEARGLEPGDGAADGEPAGAFDFCEEREIRERFAGGVRDSDAAAAGDATAVGAGGAAAKSVASESAGPVAGFAASGTQPVAYGSDAGFIDVGRKQRQRQKIYHRGHRGRKARERLESLIAGSTFRGDFVIWIEATIRRMR